MPYITDVREIVKQKHPIWKSWRSQDGGLDVESEHNKHTLNVKGTS
jgi:molybdopterin synthase catalytic subunit